MTLRVILADDHALVRAGLAQLLERMSAVEVVGQASNGVELAELSQALRPDVVLMDIAMPGLNGLDATARLLAVQPEIRVVILSMHQDKQYVTRALLLGAAGYILKDSAPTELASALEAVRQGDIYLSPSVLQLVLKDYVQSLHSAAPVAEPLTPRQVEVLRLIARGLSTKEIAQRLDLSVKTVDSHRSNLMNQLDIHEVAGLVRYAIRTGIATSET
jgi:DNA-binding NarL/FixJ family response regulator